MKKRFAAAAGSGSGFRRSLGALALMLTCGVFAAFSALPSPALAGPPPGMHHPGPGFGGPGHRPGFRPGPPPPPPRYHRGWHPRPWYRSWGFWAPTITVGTLFRSIAPRRRAMLRSRCRRFPSRRARPMRPRLPRHRALPDPAAIRGIGARANKDTSRPFAPARSAGRP